MDLRDDGVVRLAGPRDLPASTEGVSYAVAGDEVRIDAFVNDACAEQPAGVYRVVVSDTMLRLTALDESCSLRAAVFDGTWGRAGT